MKKLLTLLSMGGMSCVLLLILGCVSAKPAFGDLETKPGQDESALIFYRDYRYFTLPEYHIFVDGTWRFALKAGQKGRVVVPNGVHELIGTMENKVSRDIQRPRKIIAKSEEITVLVKAEGITNGSFYQDVNIDFTPKKKKKL